MRIETLKPTPENTLSGDKTPNYPPKGRKFIDANRGFYQKHGIEFRFAPYVKGHDGLVNVDGSPIDRSVDRERKAINEYFATQNSAYRSTLDELSSSLPKMDASCRIAVQIPAHNEERSIFQTLNGWANQRDLTGKPLDRNLFEVNVIVNGPDQYTKDNTLDEIQRFRELHPDIRLHVLDVEFTTEKGNVGMARKLMSDVILNRSVSRTEQQPLYIETGDSDILGIDPTTLARRIKTFDENPHLDVVAGIDDFQPEILKRHDLLFFKKRAAQIWKRLLQVQRLRPDNGNDMFDFHNAIPTNGWNVAFTAEAYALAGGYPSSDMQEDYDLGLRMTLMRGLNENWEGVPNTQTATIIPVRMQSSPRRAIFALAEQTNPYREFENADDIKTIREIDPEEVVGNIPRTNPQRVL